MKLFQLVLLSALAAPLLIGDASATETNSNKERLFKQTVSQFIQLASQGGGHCRNQSANDLSVVWHY